MKNKSLWASVILWLCMALTMHGSTVYFGVEDVPTGDKDYNDMVLKVSGSNFSLVSNNGGTWLPMVTPGTSGTPYWNNASFDAANANIGNCMLATGNFTGNSGCPGWSLAGTQYFGKVDGTAANFSILSVGSLTTLLTLEVSALSGSNAIYMAYNDTPNTKTMLFSGGANAGTSVTFTPDSNRSFSLYTSSNGGVTYTGSNGGFQAFAPFTQTPEPISFVLMGAGLLGIGFIRRRQIKQ